MIVLFSIIFLFFIFLFLRHLHLKKKYQKQQQIFKKDLNLIKDLSQKVTTLRQKDKLLTLICRIYLKASSGEYCLLICVKEGKLEEIKEQGEISEEREEIKKEAEKYIQKKKVIYKNSFLYIPIIYQENTIGMIVIKMRNGIKQAPLLFDIFPGITAQVLVNLKLKNMTRYDSLTRLLTRWYFEERLDDLIDKAKREKRKFSLLMIDLDHFKRINDTFGHQKGNEILIEIAKLFKEHFRDKDIIARWGGEEFSIILLDVDVKQGVSIAERLRKEVEERIKISKQIAVSSEPEKEIRVTLSIGVAEYKIGMTAEELVRKADLALLKAKEERNKVIADEK